MHGKLLKKNELCSQGVKLRAPFCRESEILAVRIGALSIWIGLFGQGSDSRPVELN
jgi:hypothetical protein